MGTPQIILIVWLSISLLIEANAHGKEKKGKHNFFTVLVSLIFLIWILISGGFFN